MKPSDLPKKQYRLLITGSRSWTNEEVLRSILTKIHDKVKNFGMEPILVHGTAPGADQMSASVWIELGGTVEPHPADWYPERLGGAYYKPAGFIRNKEMVDAGAHLCIAFIHNNSRGASMTATLAERAGIKTWRITE